ncbi:unnamed protein product [Ceutorhynchus assimilis]|uniref:adenylate cyclase n=1 Tax=Ceutorhynchus assimilis TaxID=467358 RepID=A0A9P0GKK2_9CUCU|nr:unnamed protein product [Ceutorhynchus assimilis]
MSIKRQASLMSEDDDDPFEVQQDSESYDERKWTRGHLRSQFETLELNNLFQKYTNKIDYGYFSLFLILSFFLFSTHAILLIAENHDRKNQLESLFPDLFLYTATIILSIIGLIFLEITQRRQKRWKYLCVVAFLVIFFANFFPPIYHDLKKTNGRHPYTPAYTFLLVNSCYIFFGVAKNWVSSLLGVIVSLVHIVTLILFTYKNKDDWILRVFSDIIFLTCSNGLGIYFRYLNEIVQRKSFLDRRDCIVNTFQLKHEKEQEEQLMASIIPAPLINKVKQLYVRSQDNFRQTGKIGIDKSQELLEVHEGVTILFADIVNYTVMTRQLDINALLETLNELFGRFDDASERLNVIRIKFLGDCYYCVSGLPPEPPQNPAEACVDLGLKMIKIIADVREKNNLNIDMRIGIHTGKIISGIIGKVKYQFDVWSKDVDIANKMESEGEPGKVHITNKTRNLLEKPYDIVPNNKGETVPQFKQNNLQTFLVSPMPDKPRPTLSDLDPDNSNQPPMPRPSIFRKNGAAPVLNQMQSVNLPQILEENGSDASQRSTLTIIESNTIEQDNQRRTIPNGDVRRNTVYQRRASQRYRVNEDRRLTADVKRRTAFMSTNFKRYIERSANVDKEMEQTINDLSFSKKDQYIKGKEISSFLFFKDKKSEWQYVNMRDPMFKYYVLSQVVLIICMYLIQNLSLDSWLRYEFIASQIILLLILLPCTWTYHIYLKYFTNYRDTVPKSLIVKFFYNTSKFITNNFWARLAIYTIVWMMLLSCVFLDVWMCHMENVEDPTTPTDGHCMIPWHMTESCALALMMTFLFLKIFIWIKLLYAVFTTIAYGCCVLYYVTPTYQASETFNPFLRPQIAHILSIAFMTFTLHLIDRQTDYMNRLDFLWTSKLLDEKQKADEQQAVNTNMLINILPKHVAKVYLDVNKGMNDLYFETHNHAAVMFASIIFDEAYTEEEMPFLRLMNEYITAIDTLVNKNSKVEKIKIAKWTYMAACGLTLPGDNENTAHCMETHHTSSTLEVLLNFASNMFKAFKEANGCTYDIKLRIGICHGKILAGVVGSKKPLYDIWGDPVNMASRMDSTGCPCKKPNSVT